MSSFDLIITYEKKGNTDYTKRHDKCYTAKASSEKEARLKVLKKFVDLGYKVLRIELVPKMESDNK